MIKHNFASYSTVTQSITVKTNQLLDNNIMKNISKHYKIGMHAPLHCETTQVTIKKLTKIILLMIRDEIGVRYFRR